MDDLLIFSVVSSSYILQIWYYFAEAAATATENGPLDDEPVEDTATTCSTREGGPLDNDGPVEVAAEGDALPGDESSASNSR